MSLKDEVKELETSQEVEALEKRYARLEATSETRRKEILRLKRLGLSKSDELESLTLQLESLSSLTKQQTKVPAWTKSKKKFSKHAVMPFLMLSDLHLDEVVVLEETNGINEYNRAIAVKRLDNVINKTVEISNTYINGFTYDGITAILGGDMVNGEIHDEFVATNEATIMETIVYWVPKLASAIQYLADEFGKVYLPCIRGNHDRYAKKKPSKKQAQESFTWIVYKWLADYFKHDSRITFDIAESTDLFFSVYEKTYLLTHGDNGFTGGQSNAGIIPGIRNGMEKRRKLYNAQNRPFDYLTIGHYHQYIAYKDLVINGTLKGFDEFSLDHSYMPEPPQQAFWLQSPDKGITLRMPVFAE